MLGKVSQKRWLLSRILGRKKSMNKVSEMRTLENVNMTFSKAVSGLFWVEERLGKCSFNLDLTLILKFIGKYLMHTNGSIIRYSLSGI